MVFPFRRRQPTAAELLTYAIGQRDYRAAAALIATGAAEVVHAIRTETQNTAPNAQRTFALAVAKVDSARR